jgi:hypothetical protein
MSPCDRRDCGRELSTARRASPVTGAGFHRHQTALEPCLVLAQQLERGRYVIDEHRGHAAILGAVLQFGQAVLGLGNARAGVGQPLSDRLHACRLRQSAAAEIDLDQRPVVAAGNMMERWVSTPVRRLGLGRGTGIGIAEGGCAQRQPARSHIWQTSRASVSRDSPRWLSSASERPRSWS